MVSDNFLEEIMKILAFVLATLVCFLSCSNSSTSSNGGNSANISTNSSSRSGRAQPPVNTPPAQVETSPLVGSLRVDYYEDNQLFQRFFFQDGLCVKLIPYNTQTRKKDREIAFFYKKNGELDHAKIDGLVPSKENSIEIRRSFDELNFQYASVKSKGVIFPLHTIVADEVGDLSEVLSISDNYHDFKTESEVKGDQKTIKFIDFNKTSRFHYSPMALLVGNGDFITVRDYSLTLQNGFPALEVYRISEGELTKTYSYKDGQLIGLVYKFTNLQNQSNSLEKRFDYHKLNQQP